jgi:hypothetical protein
MFIAAIIGVCVVLLVLAFVFPRLSSHPQRGVEGVLHGGERGARFAPGRLGEWLAKPFRKSRRATSKSASAGRRGRGKLPL